ncbi:type II secretion system protein GspK [Methylomicrobium sp. Wu6]|uniref:general secretion pathway protein GspK n=1 Tax=Methylomicrobium sp. Wu6 TaxID=3107928 RepID=UPI002DD6B705|nr:type II secretion system protein GspK [Methylomicrobium sp. Wu6]
MHADKGFALVLVLWVLSLLMIMAASFSLTMRRETGVIAGITSGAQALAAAESGMAMAEMMLMNPDQNKRWHTDGNIYQIQFLDALVRIRLQSETGKIDINAANQQQLQQLIAQIPIEQERQTALVSAIMDWRDQDDLVNIEGAEKDEYKAAGKLYRPSNKPFQSLEELQMVLGMDESILKQLEPLITIYSGQPQVDLSQASREVMLALGMDAALVDQCIELRRQSAITGTPIQSASLGPGFNCGSGQSNIIEVIAESRLENGSGAIIKTVVTNNQAAGGAAATTGALPFQILSWKREERADTSLFSQDKDSLVVTPNAES